MAEPTFVDQYEGVSGNGTSWTFNWGTHLTGEAANDYALVLAYKESTATVTGPGGAWTQLDTWDQTTGGFKYRVEVWGYRLAGGESGSVTWSWTGSTWRGFNIALFRNAITTESPVVTSSHDVEGAQNDQPSHPGITVARANSGLLFGTANFAASASTPPTGFTEAHNVGTETLWNYDVTSIATGATGTVASSLADPEYASSILLELATQAGAAQDTPELRGRPHGLRGAVQMQQLLAQ